MPAYKEKDRKPSGLPKEVLQPNGTRFSMSVIFWLVRVVTWICHLQLSSIYIGKIVEPG